jgi:hypothetical protein
MVETQTKNVCPSCKSVNVSEVRYGLYEIIPGRETQEDGLKIIYKGCVMGSDENGNTEDRECNDCGCMWDSSIGTIVDKHE